MLDSVGAQELEELERSLPLLEKTRAAVEELARAVEAQRSRLVRANGAEASTCPSHERIQ